MLRSVVQRVRWYQRRIVPTPASRAALFCAGAWRASGGTLTKFVHVSTASVYKGDGSRAAREDARLAPLTQQAEYSLARCVCRYPTLAAALAVASGGSTVATGVARHAAH